MTDELTEEQLAEAAAGDLHVLAALMLVTSSVFAFVNRWLGTMGWSAVALTIAGTLVSSLGLMRRNQLIAESVKISFGFSGLAAPLFGIVGLVLGLLGVTWGWAMLAGAVVYFGFSLLGLEIIERAHETGVLDSV